MQKAGWIVGHYGDRPDAALIDAFLASLFALNSASCFCTHDTFIPVFVVKRTFLIATVYVFYFSRFTLLIQENYSTAVDRITVIACSIVSWWLITGTGTSFLGPHLHVTAFTGILHRYYRPIPIATDDGLISGAQLMVKYCKHYMDGIHAVDRSSFTVVFSQWFFVLFYLRKMLYRPTIVMAVTRTVTVTS